ncbi:MAG: hypothetical protein IPG93_04750 [Burkholderiales bacterium]|nr:hypothetical protein [Burkholderiales bacterium]
MSLRIFISVLAIGACAVANLPVRAADNAALLRDLTSVIALLGVPCGKVVSATRQGDNDHIATCQDGSNYRVYLNAEGRVVAVKQ